jgi:hypothetical protein
MKDYRDFHGIEAMMKRKPMHYKKHFPWGVDYAAGTFGVAVTKFKKELRDELVTAKERKPIIDLTSEDEDGGLDDSDNELIPANEAQEEDTSGSPEVSVDDLLSAPSNDSLLVSDQQHDETTNRIDAFGGEALPVAAPEGNNCLAAGPESSILQVVSVFVCKCLLFFFLFQYFELGPIGQETRLEETFLVVKECRDEMDSVQLKYHDNQDLVALLQYQLEEENAHSWYYELQIQQMKSEQEGLEEAARDLTFERYGLKQEVQQLNRQITTQFDEAVLALDAVTRSKCNS